jgi:Fe-S-cluster containining protein
MAEFSAPLPILPPTSCDGCGLCCEGIGSPVLLYVSRPGWEARHPFRPEGLPAHLIEEIDAQFLGLSRGQEDQEQCVWYDRAAHRCRHYEWRPQVCRDYELGGEACLARRRSDDKT